MKIFGITKHLNRGGRARILALSLFILILSVFSCANDAVIDDFTNPVISDSAEKIIFSGSLRLDGAVPQALSKISNESEVTGRSAFPSLVTSETSDVKYYISARATGPEGISEEIKGSVDQTAKTYTIGLTIGRTYKVTASLKKTLTGGQQVPIMEDEWENVTPSRTNTSLTHDFILKPVKEGNGSIKLEMTLPTGIDCPRLSGDEIESRIQFHDDYTTATATISVDVIPAGTYNITINFYKSSRKFLLYSISQTINVFAGMETNTWQDDGSSNSPISAGKFVLTDEIIKNYQRTIFYVSEKDFTGKEIQAGQTRTGSPYAPFASLSDALNTIANNNKAEDYKIFIGGKLIGCTTISVSTSNAKSITIEGFTGNSKDILDGNGEGRVLQVSTEVPLTIKNLKITGGHAEGSGETGKGGGIFVAYKANVILDSGALVGDSTEETAASNAYGNKAKVAGGGIYVDAGTLILKKGSKVCRNYAGSNDSDKDSGGGGIASNFGKITIEEEAYVSYNKTSGRGGGIWLIGGNSASILTMNGGEISHNETEYWGGGILIGSVDGYQGESCPVKFYFRGGEICNNKSNSEDYGWGPGGGGLIVDHSYMEMSGSAKIHDNESKNAGGGLRIGSNSVFLMSGGEISNNTCSRTTDTDGSPISGGGLDIEPNSNVVISGSAKIPYGVDGVKGYRKNDIWLRYSSGETPSSITVGGVLTSTFEMGIGVKCQRGLVIAKADGTNVTDITPYKDYFTVIENGWNINVSGNQLQLDAPIYVAGQDTHPVCGVAGSASGNGTKGNPYDSVEQAIYAINDLNNNNAQYTILIDGVINSSQIIPADVKASYITLKGASGNTFDKINATGVSASALTIALESASKAVDIQNLTITGGNAVNGGGILIGDSAVVFLGNDLIITGNTASGLGGGVYAPNGLNVSGNVEITGNTDSSENHSNLYLPAGKKVNVTGALTKGSERAKIGISTADEPSLTSKVTFTIDYGKYNSSVAPGTYFTGDKWTVAAGSNGEACLAASGGNIIIEPVYEDIEINVDKTSVLKSATEKKFTFSATGTDSEGNTNPITIGSGEGQLALTIYSVTNHGETVPASYYDTGTDFVTLGNSLPAGNYTINTRAVYQGSLSEARTYSAGFSVKIVNGIQVTASNIDSLTFESGKKYYLAVDSAMTSSDLESLVNKIRESPNINDIGDSTLDLSAMELPAGQLTTQITLNNANITEIIIPDSLTSLWGQIAGQFQNNKKLITVTYNGTNRISWNNCTFQGCTSLKNFPWHALDTFLLGNQVFGGCTSLESVTIPADIEKLCPTFDGCSNLKEVHFLGENPPYMQDGAFADCHPDLIFYVPSETAREAYLNFTGADSIDSSMKGFANPDVNPYATTPENLAAHVRVEGQ